MMTYNTILSLSLSQPSHRPPDSRLRPDIYKISKNAGEKKNHRLPPSINRMNPILHAHVGGLMYGFLGTARGREQRKNVIGLQAPRLRNNVDLPFAALHRISLSLSQTTDINCLITRHRRHCVCLYVLAIQATHADEEGGV